MPQTENPGFNKRLEKSLLTGEENLVQHGQQDFESHGSDQLITQEQDQHQLFRFNELRRPRIERFLKNTDDEFENE